MVKKQCLNVKIFTYNWRERIIHRRDMEAVSTVALDIIENYSYQRSNDTKAGQSPSRGSLLPAQRIYLSGAGGRG
jgi:hypothetical protein